MRHATIRTRVALIATALAVTALLALGYQQLSTMSSTFSRVAEGQSLTLTTQVASATAGAGDEVVRVIPFSPDGLDGAVFFDSGGRPRASGGRLAPELRKLGPEARAVATTGRTFQQFRVNGEPTALRPWSPDGTVQVTIVPQDGGALVAGFHVDWATTPMRTRAISTVIGLAGFAMFICFGLMLMISRLVTRPVGRLASEVRQLDQGADVAVVSQQSSPELQELASDIRQMHEDLTRALRESSTDPLTGIANHRAFQEQLESAVAAAPRSGGQLALVAIDLDDLKLINDGCGHVAGDRVIAAVAGELSAACTETDFCARIGGDEFAIVCSGRDRTSAEQLAARVAGAVSALSLETVAGVAAPAGLAPSLSFGVAVLGGAVTTAEELVHAADMALYERKFGRPERRAEAARNATARLDDVVRALALAVDAKDSGTRSHCDTVAELAVEAGRALRLEDDEIDALRRAALLHDVGKIGTPDAVLLKPGRLDDAEFAVMKQHPGLGYRIVRSAGLPDAEAMWILHHHEHLDGSGYPHGLKGQEIPLSSRIILVADAFEAMTSDRPYRKSRPVDQAIAELRRCAGRQFDPAVVEVIASIATARDGGALAPLDGVVVGGGAG